MKNPKIISPCYQVRNWRYPGLLGDTFSLSLQFTEACAHVHAHTNTYEIKIALNMLEISSHITCTHKSNLATKTVEKTSYL